MKNKALRFIAESSGVSHQNPPKQKRNLKSASIKIFYYFTIDKKKRKIGEQRGRFGQCIEL